MARFWGEHEGDDHPHMEITQALIRAAIRIQSSLGPGLLEDAYKLCLAHGLRLDGHKVLREVYLDVDWSLSEILCVSHFRRSMEHGHHTRNPQRAAQGL